MYAYKSNSNLKIIKLISQFLRGSAPKQQSEPIQIFISKIKPHIIKKFMGHKTSLRQKLKLKRTTRSIKKKTQKQKQKRKRKSMCKEQSSVKARGLVFLKLRISSSITKTKNQVPASRQKRLNHRAHSSSATLKGVSTLINSPKRMTYRKRSE